MLLDATILGLGSALVGLIGAIGQALSKPWMAPELREAGLAPANLALSGVAWPASVAVLMLSAMRAEPLWMITPALLLALPVRSEAMVRWLGLMEVNDLIQIKFAAVLALLACDLGLVHCWLASPPAGAAAGLAGLREMFVPTFLGGVALAGLMATRRRLRAVSRASGAPRRRARPAPAAPAWGVARRS